MRRLAHLTSVQTVTKADKSQHLEQMIGGKKKKDTHSTYKIKPVPVYKYQHCFVKFCLIIFAITCEFKTVYKISS